MSSPVVARTIVDLRDVVYIVCETTAAITTHVRRIDAQTPVRLGGHRHDRGSVRALCGRKIGWDTRLPLSAARCDECLARVKQLRNEFGDLVEYKAP